MDATVVREISPIFEGTILERQICLEHEAIARGAHRYRRLAREAMERGESASLKPIERFMVHWLPVLSEAIKTEQRLVRAGEPAKGRSLYGPVLLSLDPDILAVLTIHETLGRCLKQPRAAELVSRLTYGIGASCIAQVHMDMMMKNDKSSVEDLDRRFKRLNTQRVNWWAKKTLKENLWSRKVCVHLGSILTHLLLKTASAKSYEEEFDPAFDHGMMWWDNHKKGVIRVTSGVLDEIESGHEFRQNLRPRYLPMLVAPYPWTDDSPGGYVRVRTPFLSKPTPAQEAALEAANLSLIYEGINAINRTGWNINDKILQVMTDLWETGGGAVGIPQRQDYPMPDRPANFDDDEVAKKKWKAQAHDIHSKNAALKGERAEFYHKLTLAQEMVGEEVFYLPHQLDFRSRAYVIPLYISHQNDDVARGLMLLHNRKPPGKKGNRRILIHLANMWGEDKCSFDDRVAWATENRAWAEDCGLWPMENTRWMDAEEPWQFLTACMALVDPDVAERLPVQADGTANALQWYAALGRDQEGAAAVNMVELDKPNDPYSDVLTVVSENVDSDCAGGHKLALNVRSYLLRKTLKQTAMTSTYGVTRHGAANQVKSQLKKLGMARELMGKSSVYLSSLTLDAVGDVVMSAKEIMNWVQKCIKEICDKYPDGDVSWTTPMGFPVVQPYKNYRTATIRTVLQTVIVGYRCMGVPLAASKQKTAGPPNLIHCLDASHMFCTAISCCDEDVDFAAVHDCYWSHAETMDQLDRILREEFVRLNQEWGLMDLFSEWQQMYPLCDLPHPPRPGTFDIEDVLTAQYFFN
jgi:DNA-directed RNA polymerase